VFIKREHLFSPKDKLLLAVSGGVDSVVLCELCKQAGYDFTIAHCNFQLRGEESERDEKFVRHLQKNIRLKLKLKNLTLKNLLKKRKFQFRKLQEIYVIDGFFNCGIKKILMIH